METPPTYTTPQTPKSTVLAILQDRPIAYHPLLAKVLGGVKQAIFVSQLLYWTGKGKRADGFIWKSQEEWTDETGLSAGEQRTARKHLVKAEILQEKLKGIPARLYYRLNTDALQARIEEYHEQDMRIPNNLECETVTAIPETTTEITPERKEPPAADSPDPVAAFKSRHADNPLGLMAETHKARQDTEHPDFMDASKDVDPWVDIPVMAWCRIAKKDCARLTLPTRRKLGGIFSQVGAITDRSPSEVAQAIEAFPELHDWWKGYDWPTDTFCQRLGGMLMPDIPLPEQPTEVTFTEPTWLGVSV